MGLIAIEALTGKRHHEFTYDPSKGLLWRDELAKHQVEVSLHLAEFIDRLIRHHWQDRFAHAGEALNVLRVHADNQQIANDSRMPTVVAAPGIANSQSSGKSSGKSSGDTTYLPSLPSTPDPNKKPRKIKKANPHLYKIAMGSFATLIALGVGVKTFQWGEYRLSQWPRTWQEWRAAEPVLYPAANPSTLTPLMADGSILLKPSAAEAFWRMVADARQDDIEIYPLSGYRAILDSGQTVGTASIPSQAVPTQAQSDYVTGYALDIGGEIAAWDKKSDFANTKTFKWLIKNGQNYGFELSSSKQGALLGTKASEEPWHWRYVGDLQSQQVFRVKDR